MVGQRASRAVGEQSFADLQALTRVNPRVYDSVAALCDSPNTTVVVFSGSNKQKLEETFGELNVWLAAENGIFMRPPGGEWSTLLEVGCFNPCDPVLCLSD